MRYLRKRRRQWLLALAIACVVALLGRLLHPPERRLLKRATRVADTRIQNANYWCWLPNGSVLLFSLVHNSWALSRLEASGLETPLPALTVLYNRIGAGEGGIISPDGRRLLWRGGNNAVFGAALDGSGFARWTLQPNHTGLICWLPDSRHWCDVAYATGTAHRHLIVHSWNEQKDPPVFVPQPPTLTGRLGWRLGDAAKDTSHRLASSPFGHEPRRNHF